MEYLPRIQEPRTDEEKYFQTEWLDKAREEIRRETEGMTSEELIAYYNEQGAKYRQEHGLEPQP